MNDVEYLEQKIRNLPIKDLSRFRAWFIEFDHLVWDKQIEADSKAGKLRGLVSDALADYQAGKGKKIE